jgi:hypothetical protein
VNKSESHKRAPENGRAKFLRLATGQDKHPESECGRFYCLAARTLKKFSSLCYLDEITGVLSGYTCAPGKIIYAKFDVEGRAAGPICV